MAYTKYVTVPIDTNVSGDTTLVDFSTAVATFIDNTQDIDTTKLRIFVINYVVNTAGANAVKFISGSTDLTGPMSLAIDGNTIGAFSKREFPVLTCGQNEDLIINLSSAVQISGHLSYFIG